MQKRPIRVYIVDDDASVRTAFGRLVRSAGMWSEMFDSVEAFMRADISDEDACVIADLHLPGRSGLQLPVLLGREGHTVPVIFVTGHDSPETRDSAKSLGAAGYFRKPVDGDALIECIILATTNARE